MTTYNTNSERMEYAIIVIEYHGDFEKLVKFVEFSKSCSTSEAIGYAKMLPIHIETCYSFKEAQEVKKELKDLGAEVKIESKRVTIQSKSEYRQQRSISGEKHKIECPNCKSTNTQRISMTSKVMSGFLFGIFSANRVINSWECKKCKYRW